VSAASGVQLWTAEPSDGEGKPCRLFGALAADEIASDLNKMEHDNDMGP
jgi:hypothetical protein